MEIKRQGTKQRHTDVRCVSDQSKQQLKFNKNHDHSFGDAAKKNPYSELSRPWLGFWKVFLLSPCPASVTPFVGFPSSYWSSSRSSSSSSSLSQGESSASALSRDVRSRVCGKSVAERNFGSGGLAGETFNSNRRKSRLRRKNTTGKSFTTE